MIEYYQQEVENIKQSLLNKNPKLFNQHNFQLLSDEEVDCLKHIRSMEM